MLKPTRRALRESKTLLQSLVLDQIGQEIQTVSDELDLTVCDDPAHLSRAQQIGQIILPASEEGWLAMPPREVLQWGRSERIADREVQELAERTLREHPWHPGMEIPPFHEFCQSDVFLGRLTLKPRQRWAIEESFGVDAYDWFVKPREITLVLLTWGKGCASGDTLLTDLRSGLTKSMREWAEDGRALLLPSWDGEKVVECEASPVTWRGRGMLYRVTLSDGRAFVCNETHKCITDRGLLPLSQWEVGKTRVRVLPPPPTAQMPDPACARTDKDRTGHSAGSGAPASAPDPAPAPASPHGCAGVWGMNADASPSSGSPACAPSGALPGRRPAPGSPGDYRSAPRSCGGSLPQGEAACQSLAPPAGDARAHNPHRSLPGDHGRAPASSRLCPECALPKGDTYQRAAHEGAAALPPRAASAAASPRALPELPIAHGGSSPADRAEQPAPPAPADPAEMPCSQPPNSFPHYSTVVSVVAIGEDDFYSPTVASTGCYFDAQGIGQGNSGKDTVISLVFSYACWAVSQMRNPWYHFRMAKGDPLDCLNVAQDANAASSHFFSRVLENFARPCFLPLLNARRDVHTSRDSAEVSFKRLMPWSTKPTEVVRLRSMNSQARAVEGANTFLFVMDEADDFRDLSGYDKARDMVNALTTSSRGFQLGALISWPRSDTGIMFEYLPKCGNRGGSVKEWWGDRAPTWEVIPEKTFIPTGRIDPATGLEIYTNPAGVENTFPDKNMERTYREDPAEFAAKYACTPKVAEGAWIKQPHIIEQAVRPDLEPCAKVIQTVNRRTDPQGKVQEYAANILESLSLRHGVPYFLGGDFAEEDDSLTLCLSHPVPPSEEGFCSPEAYQDRRKRFAKHYRPEPLPIDETGEPLRNEDGTLAYPELVNWNPQDWRCDFTGRVPDPRRDAFWGVCRSSGKPFREPVVKGYDESGFPVYELGADGEILEREVFYPLIVEDLLLEWQPDPGKKRLIDLVNAKDAILHLMRSGRIVKARFDSYEARLLIQEMQAEGLNVEKQPMSKPEQYRMYGNFLALLTQGMLELLPPPLIPGPNGARVPDLKSPEARARRQLQELVRINGKIDHPQYSLGGGKGRKDLTDSEAISFALAVDYQRSVGRVSTSVSRLPGHQEMMQAGKVKQAKGQSLMEQVLGRQPRKR